MTDATKCRHTSRRARARGLCGACYEATRRKGFTTPAPYNPHYVQDVIEEIGFMDDLTWPRLEKEFGRTRTQVQKVLRVAGRQDLINKTHIRTYGVIGYGAIMSAINGSRNVRV